MEPLAGVEPVIAPWDATQVPSAKRQPGTMLMEPLAGVEPVTCSLRMSCSTN